MFFAKKGLFSLFVCFLFSFFIIYPSFGSESVAKSNLPKISNVKVSPNGEYLALLSPSNGFLNIIVIELETNRAQQVTAVKDQNITHFFWANNERILFYLNKEGRQSPNILGVNRDGTKPRKLSRPTVESRKLRYTQLLSLFPQEENKVLVMSNKRKYLMPDLYLMDVVNGKQKMFERNSGNTQNWISDQGRIIAKNIKSAEFKGFQFLNTITNEWENHKHPSNDSVSFDVTQINSNNHQAKVVTYADLDGALTEKPILFDYDIKTKVLENPQEFLNYAIPISFFRQPQNSRVVESPLPFNNEELKKLNALIKQALPNSENSIYNASKDQSIAIIESIETDKTKSYWLFRIKEKLIEPIG